MQLSIIVPAYKVADYIERCLRSLENQDMPKESYEIIVVNDGSPDECRQIVEKLQAEFSNIVLVNQENQGVSMARNNAITIAKGKYIMPIDPDDYVQTNSFGEIFSIIDNFDADCYVLQVDKINEYDEVIWKTDYRKHNKIIYTTLNFFHETKGENNSLADPDRSWAIIYKKEIILKNNIFYPKNVPFLEDAIFVAKYFYHVKYYMLIDTPFYMRTVRKGSATNSNLIFTDFAQKGFLNGAREMYDFYKTNINYKISNDRIGFLRQTYIHFCILPLISFSSMNTLKDGFKFISKSKIEYNNIGVKGARYPFNLYGWTFFKSPYLFLLFYFFHLRFTILKNKL